MPTSKTDIYNLAASALMQGKTFANADTATGNEANVFNTHWEIALNSSLQELDLDSLSEPVTLELLAILANDDDYKGAWTYAYKYPSNCAFLRRLESGFETDNKSTHIPKRTGLYGGVKAIFTNQEDATAEIIPNDLDLVALSPMATLMVAYKLAYLSAPLITGKGAKTLRKDIMEAYVMAKAEAQEADAMENFIYQDESVRSEFVRERTS